MKSNAELKIHPQPHRYTSRIKNINTIKNNDRNQFYIR
jgi:hypothetical protein